MDLKKEDKVMNLRGGHTGVIRGLRRMGGNYVNILTYEILKIR